MSEIVYIHLDPQLEAACLSVPATLLGGLRITADDGRVFQGPSHRWQSVCWRAQQAGVELVKVEATIWP